MKNRCLAILITLMFCSQGGPINARQTTTSTTSPSTLLAQSAAALAGSVTISDVTLSGNAQSMVGSDDESGTVALKAMAPGESRMDLSLSASSRSEIRSFDANGNVVGAWSGSDAVQHAISFHNLLTDSSWFFPALTVNRLVANTAAVGIYVGQETLNGQSVLHVSFSQPPAITTTSGSAIMQHLTQMDLYLNPTTYLPVALSFAVHPDNNELLDIPVQILFSNYQTVSGVQIPFHIQKFQNGCLSLDLQVQSATLNLGLTASEFAVQVSQ
jgi:hypothetical protein